MSNHQHFDPRRRPRGAEGGQRRSTAAERRPLRRRGIEAALAGAVAASILATGGIAQAGYRWNKVATPVTAPPSTTTTSTSTSTSTPSTTVVTVTTTPTVLPSYRWR